MTVKVLFQDIKKLETEALIVGFYENVRPLKHLAGRLDWLLCGSLSHLILNRKLRGSIGEVALLTSRGKVPAPKLFLVGLGHREAASAASLERAAHFAVSCAVNAGVKHAAIECFSHPEIRFDAAVPALIKGISAARGSEVDIALLAPDAAAYEKISRLLGEKKE